MNASTRDVKENKNQLQNGPLETCEKKELVNIKDVIQKENEKEFHKKLAK